MNAKNSTISIAMTTYNGDKFVSEQIDSILNQTLKPKEIVISDDCSNDNTSCILIEYQKKYPEMIKIIFNKEHLGGIKNAEKAAVNTCGDIIAFSDQDDVWLPQKLEKQFEVLLNYPNIGMVFSDLKVVNEHLNVIYDSMWETSHWKIKGILKKEYFFKKEIIHNYVSGCTIMIRKGVLNKSLPFLNNKLYPPDYWMTLSALTEMDVFAINEQLILYRQHENNWVGAPKVKKRSTGNSIVLEQAQVFNEVITSYEILINKLNLTKNQKIYTLNILKLLKKRMTLYTSRGILNKLRIFLSLLLNMNIYFTKYGKSTLKELSKDFIFTISPKTYEKVKSIFKKIMRI